LNHVCVVVRQALGAGAVELRVYDRSDERLAAVASVPELAELSIILSSWPAADSAFRSEIRSTLRPQHAFQPGGLIGGQNGNGVNGSLSNGQKGDVDLLCALDELGSSHWFVITAARKNERGKFNQGDRRLLEELMPAVSEQILQVVAPLHERVDRRVHQLAEQYELTEAEIKVACYLLGSTLSEQDIARELHRSFNTVHRHVTNIYRKLGVRSRLEALALAEDDRGQSQRLSKIDDDGRSSSAA
jgi:DNA-binding CsgD family transcriptional regulator